MSDASDEPKKSETEVAAKDDASKEDAVVEKKVAEKAEDKPAGGDDAEEAAEKPKEDAEKADDKPAAGSDDAEKAAEKPEPADKAEDKADDAAGASDEKESKQAPPEPSRPLKNYYFKAQGNGPIKQVEGLEDVFFVEAYFPLMMGMVTLRRTMTIIRTPDGLFLINTCRLDDKTEGDLLALGAIMGVVRITMAHGIDDFYYVDKFGAKLYGLEGFSWDAFKNKSPMKIDYTMTEDEPGPAGAQVIVVENTKEPSMECSLYFADKKLLVTADVIQHYPGCGHSVTLGRFSRAFCKTLGFKGSAITPPMFVKMMTKDKTWSSLKGTFEKLQALDYDVLITAHGPAIAEGAKKLRQTFLDTVKY